MNNFIASQLLTDAEWTRYVAQPEQFTFDKTELSAAQQLRPLILKGMEEETTEIDQIINNPETPNFQNTIVALSNSGESLERATAVMYNLLSAETDDELDELANDMAAPCRNTVTTSCSILNYLSALSRCTTMNETRYKGKTSCC